MDTEGAEEGRGEVSFGVGGWTFVFLWVSCLNGMVDLEDSRNGHVHVGALKVNHFLIKDRNPYIFLLHSTSIDLLFDVLDYIMPRLRKCFSWRDYAYLDTAYSLRGYSTS